jgi:Fe(3+) dicitrate transport protein
MPNGLIYHTKGLFAKQRLYMWLFLISFSLFAEEKLPSIQVLGHADEAGFEVIKEVENGVILSGKKFSSASLSKLPVTSDNNYRQALGRIPGLYTSEVSNSAFASLSYRGLGDPHESFNIQNLLEGVPIAADMYGYPANYFSPPFPLVEKIEFIRGGSSLLYGPSPGGSLNYYLRKPSHERKNLRSGLILGSWNLINTYHHFSGTIENKTYDTMINYRKTDGFRTENSQAIQGFFHAGGSYAFSSQSKINLKMNYYRADHQEAGGLALNPQASSVAFKTNPNGTTTKYDELEIRRMGYQLSLENNWDQSKLKTTIFGSKLTRDSFRQKVGTATAFGGIYNSANNQIQTQDFSQLALESRYLRNWSTYDQNHVLSIGFLLYRLDSPFIEQTGQTVNARSGTTEKKILRASASQSFFMENRFAFNKLAITPGMRIDNLSLGIDEKVRSGSSTLRKDQNNKLVPLFGLGMTYDHSEFWQSYVNFSEAYKPVAFATAVPTGPTQSISEDIKPSDIENYELGLRGQNNDWTFDVSYFHIYYTNQFGTNGLSFINTGSAIHRGVELTSEYNLTSIHSNARKWGRWHLFYSSQWLHAFYTQGPNAGKTPQYAPDIITRAGMYIYPNESGKIALTGTFVDQHFANDTNTEQFLVPGYEVWDLTFEKNLPSSWKLVGGIHNLFDKKYYTRIRSNGIDPSAPRNYYLGVENTF